METKSDITWMEALQIIAQGQHNSGANRLYFAVFQAVYAYGLRKGLVSPGEQDSLHGKARGIVRSRASNPRKYSAAFNQLFELRVKADYKPEEIDLDDLSESLIEEAKNLREYFLRAI